MTLGLDLEIKEIKENIIWCLIVLEITIAELSIIAEPEKNITGFETGQVFTALERGEFWKISNILLLKPKKDIKGKEKTLLFLLYFLLVTRVKATYLVSGTSTAISTSKEDIEIRLEL